MAERPKVGTDISDIVRGSGTLGKTTDYLKSDPASYYYQKFISQGSKYIRDDMWTEAARRGETAALIDLISRREALDKEITKVEKPSIEKEETIVQPALTDTIDYYNKWKEYENYADYDSYMLALSIPTLDNSTKKDRVDEETGYKFGSYTDREWAIEILNSTFLRYDAQIVEEAKANQNFFVGLGAGIASGALELLAGVTNFLQDVWNIGEGLLNMFINWSNDADIGDRFLYAFSNDGGPNAFKALAYRLERDFTIFVNAEEAYEAGYRPGEDYNVFVNPGENIGASYTGWGKFWSGALDSIGYMLPSILLTAGLSSGTSLAAGTIKTIGTATFYTGIASGNVKDTVEMAINNGLSYKELNAGEVISNAAIKAAAQYGMEVLLGKILGFSGLDRLIGIGDDIGAKAITKVGATKLGAAGIALGGLAKDAIKEGLEETLQDLSDGLIDYAYSEAGTNLQEVYKNRADATIDIQNLLDSFLIGALTSVVTGGVTNAKYLSNKNRVIGLDADGKPYKLGMFQSMNIIEAFKTMNSWEAILNDKNASTEAKRDAALKMSISVNTVGSVLKSIGQDRAIKANNILVGYLNNKAKAEAISKLSNAEYATNLFNTFKTQYAEIAKSYVPDTIGNKIKNAINKLQDKLRNKNVSKIDNIITEKTDVADPDVPITKEAGTTIKSAMKNIGSIAVVGVDGAIIEKSEDILFIDNKLLEENDLAEIIKGLAYSQVRNTVRTELSKAQRDMILQQFRKVANDKGTLDNAIDALLFDKQFYTKILLLSEERNYKTEALELLSTIDKLAKGSALAELKNGTLSNDAYTTLMNKVYNTMRVGLLNYATKYARLDLDKISNEIISADLKAEIRQNPNIIFSTLVDQLLEADTEARITNYNTLLSKYSDSITADDIATLQNKIKSDNADDRIDAIATLTFLARTDREYKDTKLMYIPAQSDVNKIAINNTAKYFGVDWTKLIDGSYDPLDLTPTANELIYKKQYDMTNTASRMSAIRSVLYTVSNKTLTITDNGELIKVVDPTEILQDKYLGENGNLQLTKDLLANKVKSVKDIIKPNLTLPDFKLQYATMRQLKGALAKYSAANQTISLTNQATINTFTHEFTHGTQMLMNQTDTIYAAGGSPDIFSILPNDVKLSLEDYISEHFPSLYNIATRYLDKDYAYITYFMLGGELQANSTLATHMFDIGFKWQNNKSVLVSPDGKTKWSMKADSQKTIDNTIRTFNKEFTSKEVYTSEDRPVMKGIFKKTATEEQKAQRKEYFRSRYVSNKLAKESNLKYFIKKGRPIMTNKHIDDFVVATTKEFDKLPVILKDKIKAGKLTIFDVLDYVSTAANMNDYTFKMIARHIFKNNELAKITFKEMRQLQDEITELATLAYVSDSPNKSITPAQMLEEYSTKLNEIKTNEDLNTKWLKANRKAQTVKVKDETGKTITTEAFADAKQLNPIFFNHYNGSLASIRDINNLGKFMTVMQQEEAIIENLEDGTINDKFFTKKWNWVERKKIADVNYEYNDIAKTLNSIDEVDKINTIESYYRNVLYDRLSSMSKEKYTSLLNQLREKELTEKDFIESKLAKEVDALYELDEATLNKRYLLALSKLGQSIKSMKDFGEKVTPYEEQAPSTKNLKDALRNVGRTVTTRIAGLKSRYNALPENVKKYIDPNNKYKLSADYRTLTDEQIKALTKDFRDAAKMLKDRISKAERAKIREEVVQETMERAAKKSMSPKGKEIKTDTTEKKTLRQKVQVEYIRKIKEQTFEFTSPIESNDVVKNILNTAWDKTKMSKVQGLSNNREENVANGKKFFEFNADTLMKASLAEIEDASRWFLSSKMNNVTDSEYKVYSALKMYFLGYVYGQTGPNKIYSEMNNNLKQQIENALKSEATTAGTLLSVWNNIKDIVDPFSSMANADMVIDGVTLPSEQKEQLFKAVKSDNVEFIRKTQLDIIKFVESKKTAKKSILRKLVSIRSMSMLSSPMTWLRNKVSNMILKPLNKLSSTIGNRIFTSKTVAGQLKLTKSVTPEIQKFITENFIDNKFFDTLVGNLSKYNPSDIGQKFKKLKNLSPTISKEVIMTQLMLKSMYNEYYNRNMFKHKFMNDLHAKLMKMMSDDSYVREAAVRYFGKLLAENNYDLSKNVVTDNIMNDFAKAVGLALGDYMHSDNFFNSFEKSIADTSDLGWFAYKTILPFAAASWNWFKAAIKMSPLGLARSIVRLARLETNIQNAEIAWQEGKSQIAPELTEYIIRREFGQGVIGTIAWCLGMLLAGLGFITLEEEDYGIPKLRIGDLSIDISSIFGSSSLLAGAALVTGIKDEKSFLEGLNRMADVTIDAMPLMQIVEMDMYSTGGFSMGLDQLESIALSYIPNIMSWIAGATYSGIVRKDNFFHRAIAKIPFLVNVLEKKVDPYTGKTGSWWDAFNRFVPYISYNAASTNEMKTTKLGLNKDMLRGQYTIGGESFKVTGKDLTAINKAYGEWNAQDLNAFYNNKMSVKVKVGNSYKTLTYNQMDETQRKYAVQTIMSNNAELAKVLAWTKAGNKYYASATQYTLLRKRGVTTNVYRGTKGFVKK